MKQRTTNRTLDQSVSQVASVALWRALGISERTPNHHAPGWGPSVHVPSLLTWASRQAKQTCSSWYLGLRPLDDGWRAPLLSDVSCGKRMAKHKVLQTCFRFGYVLRTCAALISIHTAH